MSFQLTSNTTTNPATNLTGGHINGSNMMAIPASVFTIRIVCIPIWVGIIVFGVVGNILTIRVLRSKKLNNSSTSIYLIAVAFVDLVYLATSLSFRLIDYIYLFPNSVRNYSAIVCKLQSLLQFSSSYISVWLLVSVTVDRMIWVILPFRAKKICTRQKAIIIIVGLCLVFISIDSHFLWTMTYYDKTNISRSACKSNSIQLQLILTLSDFLLMGVCPFIIMIIANCLIICKLRQIRQIRENHIRKAAAPPIREDNNSQMSGNECPLQTNTAAARSLKHKERTSSLTTMLLSINVFFMVSITPLLAYDIIYTCLDLDALVARNEDLYGPMIFAIENGVYTLWYLNFSVHFLLYCMSGPKFRVEALKLFGIKPVREVGEYQTGGTEMQTYKRRESCRSPVHSPSNHNKNDR